MRPVLKPAHRVVSEHHQPRSGPYRSPRGPLFVASRRGPVVEDAAHVHQIVGVLVFEREVGQQPAMHDQGFVLRKLEPEREGRKPLPILQI